jgi:hypothetical protein
MDDINNQKTLMFVRKNILHISVFQANQMDIEFKFELLKLN